MGQDEKTMNRDELAKKIDKELYSRTPRLSRWISGATERVTVSNSNGMIYIDLSKSPEKTQDMEKFLESLGIVYCRALWHGDTTMHNIFFVFSDADKELLDTKAKPTEGNVIVLPGEFAITHAKDPNPILSTKDLYPNIGVSFYDPMHHVGGIAHIDYGWEMPRTIEKMIEKLEMHGGSTFVFGMIPDMSYLVKNISGLHAIISKYLDRFEKIVDLPKEFSLDTRYCNLSDFKEADDPTLERRLERRDYRINKGIPPICCTYEP